MSSYEVKLHKGDSYFKKENRGSYFSGIDSNRDQIVFLDPDNGFEPEKSYSEKHVRYSELTKILGQLTNESFITVFQHFRRIPFDKDFKRINERIEMIDLFIK